MGVRSTIKFISEYLGYKFTRVSKFSGSYNPNSLLLPQRQIVDLERLSNISLSIPGMISPRSGQMLYALCAFQDIVGDVVEIGSWQGRSSSFLARAVKESGNGKFYAIDHFKGNLGKESAYMVGAADLSDLKQNFLGNMEAVGLSQHFHVMDMSNTQAAIQIADKTVRLLFIDGDHTYEGVRKDLELFVPKLCDNAIVIFDDFSNNFPGLLGAVDEFLRGTPVSRVMAYENTLVIRM
jgi:MMP 1-O-methyltransferase